MYGYRWPSPLRLNPGWRCADGGQLTGSLNHFGLFHHKRVSGFIDPPRLQRPAGFCCFGTCLHVTASFCLILRTWLATICSHPIEPLIKYKATLLTSHTKPCKGILNDRHMTCHQLQARCRQTWHGDACPCCYKSQRYSRFSLLDHCINGFCDLQLAGVCKVM